MVAYLLRRGGQTLITLLVMSVLVFVGVYLVGNPVDVMISASATPQERTDLIIRMGLDQPVWVQYWHFLTSALSGDLGSSFLYNRPALGLIFERMPATLELAFTALFIAIAIGIPLGVIAGLRPSRPTSRGIMAFSILGFSLPTFWVGLMMILVFAVYLGWLPASGRGDTIDVLGVPVSILTFDGLSHIALPALNLALFKISLVIRLTRAGVSEALQTEYVRFARAKGLSETRVVFLHVLKNTLIPLITVIGLELGSLIAFAVVTETIFSWPGMGKLIIDAITSLDRPVILAYLLITVFMFTLINLLVDLAYTVADPRVKLDGGTE